MKIAIVAGELSGDQLGAGLVIALKKLYPNAEFVGVAGPKMQKAGVKSLYDMETLSVMGLFEVLKHLPAILKVRKGLFEYFSQAKPDVFIGIDAPDFNLGLAKKLKAIGIKTVQYVSPSIWAWREGRIKKIKQATDLVLCILPFELQIYKKHNHPAVFVGHPMADEVPLDVDKAVAKQVLNLNVGAPVLALLPGSRAQELDKLLAVFLETAAICKQKLPNLQIVLPLAKPSLANILEPYKDEISRLSVTVLEAKAKQVLAASDSVLLASGTATLETMLYKAQMVVAYKMSNLTYRLAKLLVKVKYCSLPNLLANKPLVPEFIQDDVNADNLSEALLAQLTDNQDNQKLIAEFTNLHMQLKQNADQTAAGAVRTLLQ